MATREEEAQSSDAGQMREPQSPVEPALAAGVLTPRGKQPEVSPQGRYIREEKKLGAGAYKDVWRAYDTQEGIEVAWNVVKLSKIPATERKRIKTEVSLLKTLDHPNIIKYFGSWVDRQKELIIFVTEMLSSGSLKDYINRNRIIRWAAVKRWCRQLLKGLAFLHEKGVIHRDIKCDNIFINGATGDIRIGDLGLSIHVAEDRTKIRGDAAGEAMANTAMTCLGTPEFMAPELYEQTYDNKVDIYAFGMCALEMITQQIPFSDCAAAAQIYRKVFVLKEMPHELELVSNADAKNMIQRCLQWNAADRPSAASLLDDPFFDESDDDNKATIEPETPASRRAATGEVAMEDLRLDSELELDEDGGLTPPFGSSTSPVPRRGSQDDMDLNDSTRESRTNRSMSEPAALTPGGAHHVIPPEFEGIQTTMSSIDPSSVKIDVSANWGDDNEIAFDLRFQVGAERHEFATSYSPTTDTPEDFVRECRDFVVATFRLPVDVIRSGQLVQQVKEAIARLRQQPERSELRRSDSQSPVPSEVHGEILSPQSHRSRTSSSSPALSPEMDDRDNVFFPTDPQLQGNLTVNTYQPISAAALAELDKTSELERGSESERLSELELDSAAEVFLATLEQEFETRKREIEETHRRQAERLEQRQKTVEDDYQRKINKIVEKQAHLQRQVESLQEQQEKRLAELDRGVHDSSETLAVIEA